jgi:hypothetical protein
MEGVMEESLGHGEKQSRRTEIAIAALLSEPTIAAAATVAKVDCATLRKWLRNEKFLAKYRQARRQVVEHAVGRLQEITSKAVATLEHALVCGHKPTCVRAALGILEHATKAVELS